MDFADVINDLTDHMNGSSWEIRGLVAFPDLTDFQQQETDMRTLPVEWVNQKGSEDFGGYYGTIYFPTAYPNGDGGVLHLHVEYHE